MVSHNHEVCIAAEHAERQASPSTTEFGVPLPKVQKSIKWKNPEDDFFLTIAAWLGKSVLNLIWHSTPRSDVNWLSGILPAPNEYFYDN